MRVFKNLGITIMLGMELIFYTIVRVLSIPMEKNEDEPSKNSNGITQDSRERKVHEEEDILGI